MIRGYSAEQVRTAEQPLLAAGVPLMQRAAAGLAREIRSLDPRRALVLAGAGNNGADALFAAAELATGGVDVAIVLTGDHADAAALDAALAAGGRVHPAARAGALAASVDVVIDGILGTGTSADPSLRGTARDVVAAVRALPHPPTVVAVDIPSGIGPTDGSVPDPCVLAASITVTFGGYKAGLLLPPGSGFAGEIRLVDIGLGEQLASMTPVVVIDDGCRELDDTHKPDTYISPV
jgi:NAD(P)H-hydrate epimerase